MHAWVGCEQVPDAADMFEQGKNYMLRNFIVEPFSGKYRCFKGQKHIVVTSGTSVTPLPDAWGLIPHDVCYFTNLQDIETIEPKDSYLIGKVFILVCLNFILHSV